MAAQFYALQRSGSGLLGATWGGLRYPFAGEYVNLYRFLLEGAGISAGIGGLGYAGYKFGEWAYGPRAKSRVFFRDNRPCVHYHEINV